VGQPSFPERSGLNPVEAELKNGASVVQMPLARSALGKALIGNWGKNGSVITRAGCVLGAIPI
jgi:hypothetical protein